MQMIDLLLSLIDDLAEVAQLQLTLLKDRVDVKLGFNPHFFYFTVQGVVISRETLPILSLNLCQEKVTAIGVIYLAPKFVRIGFNL